MCFFSGDTKGDSNGGLNKSSLRFVHHLICYSLVIDHLILPFSVLYIWWEAIQEVSVPSSSSVAGSWRSDSGVFVRSDIGRAVWASAIDTFFGVWITRLDETLIARWISIALLWSISHGIKADMFITLSQISRSLLISPFIDVWLLIDRLYSWPLCSIPSIPVVSALPSVTPLGSG